MSITAIAGVLFTSVLIGIITSAIEEKIDNLKRGNSFVLEIDRRKLNRIRRRKQLNKIYQPFI